MLPILFSIGPFAVSSFGVFATLGLILATFVIWRLSTIYDIDPEKTLDLIFWTFITGFIGSRAGFVIFNLNQVKDLSSVFLLNRYPGLSFWGGLVFGIIAFYIFIKRLKLNFWLIADIFVVGLFGGLFLGSFGCLLSACQYGYESNLPIAVSQVGLIGQRFPIQIFVSLFFLISLVFLWRKALKFHFAGKIGTIGLIILSLIKFTTSFFRADLNKIYNINSDQLISFIFIIIGIGIYYLTSKRSLAGDLAQVAAFFINSKVRSYYLLSIKKNWYNLVVNFKVGVINFRKRVLKKLNVKSNPKEF